MKKSILALLMALAILVSGSFALAEEDWDDDFEFLDDEDFEDFDDLEDFDDVGTEEEFIEAIEDQDKEEYKQKVQQMSDLSGYNNPDLLEDGDYSYFVSEDGTYCITSLYKGTSTDVIVPSTLGGYPVRVIGDHTFENKGFINTIEVPEGVVAIGKQAFFMCINLQTVIVPEGVVYFGDQCFAACYMLDYVQVPDTLESVGEMAFLGCYALKEIEFGQNLKSIGSCAFHTCKELEKVTLPSDEVTVDATAFLQCPDNVEIIYSNKS